MTSDSPPKPVHHRQDIQGLRALAVLGVISFHAFGPIPSGGFVVLDIFFVLSGFLIAGILLRELDQGRFSFVTFYRRRVARVFPALFAMLAFTLIVGAVVLAPKTFRELSLTAFFTMLFTSNLAFIRISGYFDATAALRPLLHTWSLGVEEQFYLLFPPLLWVLHRYARRWLWPALAILACLSLWQAEQFLGSEPAKAYYHPYGRAVELLIGALAYGLNRHWKPTGLTGEVLAWGGLAAIVASLLLLNETLPFPGLLAMPTCLGTAAILLTQEGRLNRWLGIRPLAVVGDMSYSLYLWHWPLLVYGHLVFGLSAWVSAVAVVLTFGVGWLSRHYLEQPVLDAQRRWPIWWMALAAMSISIGVCVLIYTQNGLPQRFSAREQRIFAGAENYNHDRKRCHKRSNGVLPYDQTCVYGEPGVVPTEAVWGDSLGAELASALGERLGRSGRSLRSITASGCPAEVRDNDANCAAHNAQILAGLTRDENIRRVILIANFTGYVKQPHTPMPDSLFEAALALKAAGKIVVVIEPLPLYGFDPPSEAGIAVRMRRDPREVGQATARYDQDNGAMIARLRAFGRANAIAVVPVRDLFCDAQRCRVYDPAAGMLYFDRVHPSLAGAGRIADRLIGLDAEIPARPLPGKGGM
ncbi:acyltransferase family protein [soil metagenome]